MKCNSCQTEKHETAFYKSNRKRCMDCVKQSVNAHRQANLEKIRSYDRMRASQPHRMANNYTQTKDWRQKNPDGAKAQRAVAYAIKTGKLKKQPCWVCGEKAIAHHPSYDMPLDVVWLCQPHHKQAHALVSNEPIMQKEA